jgi:hypothetical protein
MRPIPHLLVAPLLLANSIFAATPASKPAVEMKEILTHYIQIQSALAGDTEQGVKDAAKKIQAMVSQTGVSSEKQIRDSAQKLTSAQNIQAMREAFKKLSIPVVNWAKQSKPAGYQIVYCSMAPGRWVQKEGSITNPYYGAEMLECGEIEKP